MKGNENENKNCEREKGCIHISIKWENILELNNKQCKKEEKAF